MEQETRKAAEKVMEQRFGQDTLVALATADERGPSVRTVNAYYEKGSFMSLPHRHQTRCARLQRIRGSPLPGIGFQRMVWGLIWDGSGQRKTGKLQKVKTGICRMDQQRTLPSC